MYKYERAEPCEQSLMVMPILKTAATVNSPACPTSSDTWLWVSKIIWRNDIPTYTH